MCGQKAKAFSWSPTEHILCKTKTINFQSLINTFSFVSRTDLTACYIHALVGIRCCYYVTRKHLKYVCNILGMSWRSTSPDLKSNISWNQVMAMLYPPRWKTNSNNEFKRKNWFKKVKQTFFNKTKRVIKVNKRMLLNLFNHIFYWVNQFKFLMQEGEIKCLVISSIPIVCFVITNVG